MKKVLRSAAAIGAAAAALVGIAGVADSSDRPVFLSEELGYEGCTPGFWKNHPNAWADTWLSPDASLEATFGVDLPGPDMTLLQALNQGGGGFTALGRHAVAGLLNARTAKVDYPYRSSDIIAMVQGAVASGDPTQAHEAFASSNELGCPTNGK